MKNYSWGVRMKLFSSFVPVLFKSSLLKLSLQWCFLISGGQPWRLDALTWALTYLANHSLPFPFSPLHSSPNLAFSSWSKSSLQNKQLSCNSSDLWGNIWCGSFPHTHAHKHPLSHPTECLIISKIQHRSGQSCRFKFSFSDSVRIWTCLWLIKDEAGQYDDVDACNP